MPSLDIVSDDAKHRVYLQTRLREAGVPQSLWDGLIEYIVTHRPTGHFLRAVLENDLKGACARVDFDNRPHLFDIVYFLYNYAPIGCWGSKEQVKNWLI